MKKTIIATDKEHLLNLIKNEIKLNGASLDNKVTAIYDCSISESSLLTMEEMKNIVSLAKTVNITEEHRGVVV